MSEWQPIHTFEQDEALWQENPTRVLLWVENGSIEGKGVMAFGRIYKNWDGTKKASAEGFCGNWNIPLWAPLPENPR